MYVNTSTVLSEEQRSHAVRPACASANIKNADQSHCIKERLVCRAASYIVCVPIDAVYVVPMACSIYLLNGIYVYRKNNCLGAEIFVHSIINSSFFLKINVLCVGQQSFLTITLKCYKNKIN